MTRTAQMSFGKRVALRLPPRPFAPRQRLVSDLVEESLRRQLDLAKTLGLGLSCTFFSLWIGTLVLIQKYPAFFNLAHASCQ